MELNLAAFTVVALFSLTNIASACDFSFPQSGSVVKWPERLLSAEVKILNVHKLPDLDHKLPVRVDQLPYYDRYARARLVQTLKGDMPREFNIGYEDHTSCGSQFKRGETRVAGFVLLNEKRRTKNYRYAAHSYSETWARAVFVGRSLTLSDD